MTSPVTVDRASYEAAVAQLRAQVVALAAAVWASATLRDEMVSRLTEVFAPAVVAAQLQVANLTSVYLAAVTNTEPVPVDDVVAAGRGVPNDVVYARPVIQARSLVAKGKSVDAAFEAGGRRLKGLATTDLQMAKVRQADASLAAAGEHSYRRVPTGNETCAMCLIAATQRYKVGNLQPLHGGCDCTVDIIPAGMDLDDLLMPDQLFATHEQVEALTGVRDLGGRAVDYRKLLVTHEHGEIGPVIAWRGQKFTSVADLAA